jgi:hypothetical protein
MNFELHELIAKLIIEDDPDLQLRLEYQQEALRDSVCVNPVLGQWIDNNNVQYLLDALSLVDDDFAERFPSVANLPSPLRHEILTTFEEHFELCKHCALKKAYELELEARINRSWLNHHDRLLRHFQKDEPAADGEEQYDDLLSTPVWAGGVWSKSLLYPQRLMLASVVSILLLTMCLIILHSYSSQQKIPNLAQYQQEMSRREQTDSNVQVVQLNSKPLLRSGGGEISRISIRPTTSAVHFHLKLPVDGTYRVKLENVVSEVFTLQNINCVNNDLSIFLPADLLPRGDYRITVSADHDDRSYSYFFRVTSVNSDD